MKTIISIIFILCIQSISFGQLQPVPQTESKTNSKHCSLNYSDDKWVLSHHDELKHKCNEIVIMSIPPVTKKSSPIDININIKGFYTIKKDPSLQIPDDYIVGVEDGLTGQIYNLGTQDGYTFSLNRISNEVRFVMEIKKNNLNLSHGSTASN